MNSYTYEKLHVWKVTRIEYWVLIGALLYAYRFFHGTFDTRMFSNVKLFIRGTFGAFCPLRPTIHICVGSLIIIGSDNGLSPNRRKAINWTNAGILLIGPLGTNFSEISIQILTFSFKKIHLKVSSAKWRPFCLGRNVLTRFCGAPSHEWHFMTHGQYFSTVVYLY